MPTTLTGNHKPYAESGLCQAIAILGGMSQMARDLTVATGAPVSRQVIFQWKKYGRIPSWFIPHIHKLTNIPYDDLLAQFLPVGKEEKQEPQQMTLI